jgi:hypothetical protein
VPACHPRWLASDSPGSIVHVGRIGTMLARYQKCAAINPVTRVMNAQTTPVTFTVDSCFLLLAVRFCCALQAELYTWNTSA